METTVTLDRLIEFYGDTARNVVLEGDYMVREIHPGEAVPEDAGRHGFRCEGAMLILVKAGTATLEIDGHSYHIPPSSVFFLPPKISAIFSSEHMEGMGVRMLFMSIDFLQNLNFSISALRGPSLLEHRSPVSRLSDEEMTVTETYFDLLEKNARSGGNTRLRRQLAANLCVATLYQILLYVIKNLETDGGEAPDEQRRPLSYHVRQFVRLVHANFSRERSVGYYASQLCVSPKYLSSLVKAATGRTAARWIDDYVIMEAKNLLRFSGKNIQQVAYDLNFPNQSAFGKYFKHLTGMSPTEFQKS